MKRSSAALIEKPENPENRVFSMLCLYFGCTCEVQDNSGDPGGVWYRMTTIAIIAAGDIPNPLYRLVIVSTLIRVVCAMHPFSFYGFPARLCILT